jgi:hypothetical protein
VTKLRSIFRRHERRDPELLALAAPVGVALLRESLSIHVVHLRAILALRR